MEIMIEAEIVKQAALNTFYQETKQILKIVSASGKTVSVK
jgi:hypothetical protein